MINYNSISYLWRPILLIIVTIVFYHIARYYLKKHKDIHLPFLLSWYEDFSYRNFLIMNTISILGLMIGICIIYLIDQ